MLLMARFPIVYGKAYVNCRLLPIIRACTLRSGCVWCKKGVITAKVHMGYGGGLNVPNTDLQITQ